MNMCRPKFLNNNLCGVQQLSKWMFFRQWVILQVLCPESEGALVGAHAGGSGEADSLCNPCQQRMQKHLPAAAEVPGLGVWNQQSCSCR